MEQIRAGMLRRLSDAERSLEAQMSLIAALSPKSRLNNAEQRLDELSAAIRTGMHHRLDRAEQSLKANAEIISALDPLGVLARGFSLTSTDRGIVTSAAQLSPGDSINVRLSEGSVRATVTEIL